MERPIRLDLSDGSATGLVELSTGWSRIPPPPGYRIERVAVEPAPEGSRPVQQGRYRATLRPTRAP